MQIDIDFDVFQHLTLLRTNESDSYSDVIRRLMAVRAKAEAGEANALLASEVEPLPTRNALLGLASFTLPQSQNALAAFSRGFYSRGLWLPDGTSLRATYQGKMYVAEIHNSQWIQNGVRQSSPSAAASAITGNNVNGLRFWEAKRPGDVNWSRLELLVSDR